MAFLINTTDDIATARDRLLISPTFALSLERDIMSLTETELSRLEPWVGEMVKRAKNCTDDEFTPRQTLAILTAVAIAIAAVYSLAPSRKEINTNPFSLKRAK